MNITYAKIVLHQPECLETQVFLYRHIARCAVAGHAGFISFHYLKHIAHFRHRHKQRLNIVVTVRTFANNIQFAFDVVWRDMERVHQQIVNDALYELREEKLNV